MTKSQFCLGLTCLSVGAWACNGESELLQIESQQAALTAAENSERALDGVIDAADFLAASTSIAETLGAFSAREETCSSSGVACSGLDCPVQETVCTSGEVDTNDLEEQRQEIRSNAQELVRMLRERILIEENLEEQTSTSATYRISADVLCSESDEPPSADDSSDDSDSADTFDSAGSFDSDELDSDCVDEVNRLQPRLVLTSPSEGDIDVTLQLGAQHREPLTLALYHDSLGVQLDLGEALAVARELGESDDLENVDALSGVLELRLVENAARDYSLELNVLEAIEAVVDSDGQSLTASLGASAPAWNVRVDGNSQTLSAGIDLAAFRVTGPLRAFASLLGGSDEDSTGDAFGAPIEEQPAPRAYHGVLDMFLAGLSGSISYTANTDVLALDDLGFGDETSTIKHDDRTLFALDLNPSTGRHVNLRISPADGGGANISITPSFDLRMELAFHYIADQIESLSSSLLDDTFLVWFDGAAPMLHVGDDQVQVSSGTLHVESTATPSANVTVSAGMCLGGSLGAEDDVIDTGLPGDESTDSTDSAQPWLSLEATSCE